MRRLTILALAALLAACAGAPRRLLPPAAFGGDGEIQRVLAFGGSAEGESLLAALAVTGDRAVMTATTPLGIPALAAELRGTTLRATPTGYRLPVSAEELVADLQFGWWPEAAVADAYAAPPWSVEFAGGERRLRRKGRLELVARYPSPGTLLLEDPVRGFTLSASPPGGLAR